MKLLFIFLFSSLQATISTIFSIALALPLAHFFYRYNFKYKHFFLSLALLLCIMPTKLIVLCVSSFYGMYGFSAIVFAHLLLNLPFSLYVFSLTYKKLDLTLLWVAQDLGATPWQTYRDVEFPFLRTTIFSMAVILFLLHAASFSIPLLLGGQWYHHTAEIMISNFYNEGQGLQAFLFWVLRLFFLVPIFLFHVRQKKIMVNDVAQPARPQKYSPSIHGCDWLFYGIFILIITLGPFGALIVRACDWSVFTFLKHSLFGFTDYPLGVPVRLIVFNSVLLAIVSSVFAVALACAIGFLMKYARLKMFISLLTIFPFLLGSVGIGILFNWFSLGKIVSAFFVGVLCHTFLNYPFAYRVIAAQFDLVHPDLSKTAQTYGATHTKVLRTVTLPFIFPALIRAFCISFGLSLTEVGAGSVLSNKLGLTLPMAMRIYYKAGMHTEFIGLGLILFILVLLMSCLVHPAVYRVYPEPDEGKF